MAQERVQLVKKSAFKQWQDKRRRIRERKQLVKNNPAHDHKITLRQVIMRYLQSKIKFIAPKQPTSDPRADILPMSNVTHIAIVLAGRVEDVIRTEDRMAALLLSEPEFVEFDPKQVYPIVGVSEYTDGEFKNTVELKQHVEPMIVPPDFDIFDYLTDEEKEMIEKREKEQGV